MKININCMIYLIKNHFLFIFYNLLSYNCDVNTFKVAV